MGYADWQLSVRTNQPQHAAPVRAQLMLDGRSGAQLTLDAAVRAQLMLDAADGARHAA
jgi:hypothetical protein